MKHKIYENVMIYENLKHTVNVFELNWIVFELALEKSFKYVYNHGEI